MDATASGRESRLSNLDGQGKEEEGSVKDFGFSLSRHRVRSTLYLAIFNLLEVMDGGP